MFSLAPPAQDIIRRRLNGNGEKDDQEHFARTAACHIGGGDQRPEYASQKNRREEQVKPSGSHSATNARTHTRRADDVIRESGTECAIRRCVQ